jgi:hypothetical protein
MGRRLGHGPFQGKGARRRLREARRVQAQVRAGLWPDAPEHCRSRKKPFPTPELAEAELAQTKAVLKDPHTDRPWRQERYYYRCPHCGTYHLTKERQRGMDPDEPSALTVVENWPTLPTEEDKS